MSTFTDYEERNALSLAASLLRMLAIPGNPVRIDDPDNRETVYKAAAVLDEMAQCYRAAVAS